MFRKNLIMSVILIWASMVSTQVNATPVISNGNFESGALSPWYQDGNQSSGEDWNVTSALAHTGTYSATVDANKEIRQNLSNPIAVGDINEISFWLYSPDVLFSAYSLFYSDSSISSSSVTGSIDTWTFFDVTSDLTAGKSLVAFSLWGSVSSPGGPNRSYLDDVVIDATIPEPTTLALMGLGLAGIGWKQRKAA